MHVRQPEIPARIPISKPFMIEPEQMQQRRMKIVNMHPVLLGPKPEIIGRPMHVPRLHSPARQPHRKPIRVVIPPVGPVRV